jgi:UDP-4-amino-4,6-dideoxy-N-acetyl-beta-L-altrosamine transaminase
MIPYGKQSIDGADIEAVIDVLRSDFLTQGPRVPEFERIVSNKVGAKYGLATNSATSALHIACMSLGLGEGDFLWTSPISFVASANCGLYCGAKINFVDIDLETYNICVRSLEEKLEVARRLNRVPKVLVVVHLCGQPCDMSRIHELALEYDFKIIEDASHAIGAKYKDSYVGNCEFSDITIFSFHPVKIITTAEGGMAVTNDIVLAKRMDLLRSHGITRDESMFTRESHGGWYYEQVGLGYNYRMNELQAALGISQMEHLDTFIAKRHELAKRYDSNLVGLPIELPISLENSSSSMHLYVIRLKLKAMSLDKKQLFAKLMSHGISVNVHYIPIHTQPFYRAMGFDWGDFPAAETYYSEAMSLPLFPSMTVEQQDYVIATLSKIIG